MNNRGAFFFSACLLTGCATDPGDFTPEPDGGSITLDAGMRGDGAITVLDAGRRDSAVPEVDAGPPAWWGEPIDESEAPKGEWTFVEFPDSRCANGTPTGIGINPSPSPNPTGLFIYMEGGGACWTYEGCQLPIVLHTQGVDQETWDNDLILAPQKEIVPFQRDNEHNPFRDAHYVFVPYCTADVHAGNKVTELTGLLGGTRTMHFRGYNNVTEYLERLVPTFHDTPRVWLTGSSAGGFGAELNWLQVQERFGDVRVDVISDSGQPIMPKDGYWEDWIESWDIQFPEDCADCDQGMYENLVYFSETLLARGSRYGLIVYTRDFVISSFLGLSQDEHEARVLDLLAKVNDPMLANRERASYFALDASFHTTFLSGFDAPTVMSEDMRVYEWVQSFVDDVPTSRGPD